MTDFVERLRQLGSDMGAVDRETCNEAAKEIEQLRANIERLTTNPADYRYWEGRYRDEAADNGRLRAALREIVEYADKYGISDEGDGHALVNIARSALHGKT